MNILNIEKKTLLLSDNLIKISFGIFNKQRFFLISLKEQQIFLKIPSYIFLKKKNNVLFFYSANNFLLNNFLFFFDRLLVNINKKKEECILFRSISSKGLGFRIFLKKSKLKNQFYLKCKVGLSHFIRIWVPNKIKVKIQKKEKKRSKKKIKRKNKILLMSNIINSYLLGSFAERVKNLKFPNIYNGRGFWFRTDKIILKKFKKK
jgi:hypothetical protein